MMEPEPLFYKASMIRCSGFVRFGALIWIYDSHIIIYYRRFFASLCFI